MPRSPVSIFPPPRSDRAMPRFAANLSMMFGAWPFLHRFAAAASAYRGAVRLAGAAAALHGMDIVIEPINGRDMPGYFLNDFGMAAAIIAELALPNLKLQFDIYHRQIIHGDVTRGLETLMPI